MSKKEKSTQDLLKDLMIIQLGLANVPQSEIRNIIGCDIGYVNRIVKILKKVKK
ncbi:MAG: hypothetical protein WCW66_06005 [Patescibacteria group bacterium]|jgi:hypothetical protein